MSTLLPESLPAEVVERHLLADERIVSSFGPYHATSRRVILINERGGESRAHELPYSALESITEVKLANVKVMALGALVTISGIVTLFFWYLVMPIIAVALGIFIGLYGAAEKPAYYQLKARDMDDKDLRRWQVRHYGAGSFIASISAITGIGVTRD